MASSSRTVLVTGAGRGIGRAIAERFAAAGDRVALVSRSAGQLQEVADGISAAGGTALALPADVTDEPGIREVFARAEGELGPVEVAVNNAGSFYALGPVWEVDPERWWRDIEINVFGVFLSCRAALEGMRARGSGRIINLIGGGTANPFPYGSGYGSSKAAVMRLTETLDAELRAEDSAVRVFAMGPGLVRTVLTEYQLESPEGQQWMSRIGEMFDQGRDVPPTRAAELAFALAGGQFDALSGRAFGVGDDLEDLLKRQDEILRKDLKTLRFR
jgi:NAD(P)-dependent dehydrogenase (short-subunit alcohol dehydrogenase family)